MYLTINWLNLRVTPYCILWYIMRKSLALLALAALFTLTGCDFFRTLAGRPTSEDIEVRKLQILLVEQARHQARIDSLKIEQQRLRDSLAILDSLAALDMIHQNGGTILNPSAMGGLFATRLESRYHIIIGSFRRRDFAEKLLGTASECGYSPSLISFRSGLIAVGLCPCNTLTEASESLAKVRLEPFCPHDVWILVNE